MEKGINTEKDFEIAKKIAHVLSGDCSEENRSSLDEWLSESEGNRNLYERILDDVIVRRFKRMLPSSTGRSDGRNYYRSGVREQQAGRYKCIAVFCVGLQ